MIGSCSPGVGGPWKSIVPSVRADWSSVYLAGRCNARVHMGLAPKHIFRRNGARFLIEGVGGTLWSSWATGRARRLRGPWGRGPSLEELEPSASRPSSP